MAVSIHSSLADSVACSETGSALSVIKKSKMVAAITKFSPLPGLGLARSEYCGGQVVYTGIRTCARNCRLWRQFMGSLEMVAVECRSRSIIHRFLDLKFWDKRGICG